MYDAFAFWWQVHPFMMEAVRQMAQTHPRLKIDFVETSYGDAAEGFAQGLFDLFFSTDSLALRQRRERGSHLPQ
ncbi:hypothetical protein NE553_16105, partial [Eggerthella lenta]|nr:hypothetical protein [Eggerthella lenta]